MKRFYRQRRILFFLMFMMICFSALIFRLYQLQLCRSAELSLWAVKQRAQSVVLYHGRGDIQDRHGRSLLDSYGEEVMVAFPVLYRGHEEEIYRRIPELDPGQNPELAARKNLLEPILISRSSTGYFSSLTELLPGLIPARRTVRYGPDALAVHVVGHVRRSDGVGEQGIELFFNNQLSGGRLPALSALVDGRKNLIGGLGYRLWENGYGYASPQNVVLTLHYDLQKRVEEIMDRRIIRGAVVVMDPRNGDILAMASRPDFHPGDVEEYTKKDDDEANLTNRAGSSYQPGSVFKTVLAAAAFEEGYSNLFAGYFCGGSVEIHGHDFGCSQLHPAGEMSFLSAFSFSCNSAFIRLGQELGGDMISRYARLLGLGKKTGIPVDKESPGYIPSAEELHHPINLANASIGQGRVEVTPLQVARMFSIIANGGRRVEPRLILSTKDAGGRITRYFPVKTGEQLISQATVNRLKYMLHDVTVNGLGRAAALTDVPAGGKTGTAQSGKWRDGKEILNHWFAGFAPLQNTRIVVVVFADELAEGSASMIFKEVTESALAVLD